MLAGSCFTGAATAFLCESSSYRELVLVMKSSKSSDSSRSLEGVGGQGENCVSLSHLSNSNGL